MSASVAIPVAGGETGRERDGVQVDGTLDSGVRGLQVGFVHAGMQVLVIEGRADSVSY
jgi:hypothetical protein